MMNIPKMYSEEEKSTFLKGGAMIQITFLPENETIAETEERISKPDCIHVIPNEFYDKILQKGQHVRTIEDITLVQRQKHFMALWITGRSHTIRTLTKKEVKALNLFPSKKKNV